MKLLIILVICFMFFYMFGGGSEIINEYFKLDNDSKLAGEWDSITNEAVFYTFYKSGKYIMIEDENPISGTWKITADSLYLTSDETTNVYEISFKPGNKIVVITSEDDMQVLEKTTTDDFQNIRDIIPFEEN